MDYILDLLMIPLQVIIVFYTLYYFVLAVAGMWRRKEKRIIRLRTHLPLLYVLIMKRPLSVNW